MKKLLTLSLIAIHLSLLTPSFAQITTLLNFGGGVYYPNTAVVLMGGTLYGATLYGGGYNEGTVYKVDTNGNNYTSLLVFFTNNGDSPYGTVTTDGKYLYGTTWNGGYYLDGVIYEIDTSGNFYGDIFKFQSSEGFGPKCTLVRSNSTLFGTTYWDGIVFKVSTIGGGYTKLATIGDLETGSLILSGDMLYGMSTNEGVNDSGFVFKVDTNGNNYQDIFDFNGINGSLPNASLIISGSTLYGMTNKGGINHTGVAFKVGINGTGFTKMIDFTGANGESPYGSLTLDGNTLYGTTVYGGAHNKGLIFKIDTNGTGYTDVVDFDSANGSYPESTLLLVGSTFFGTTVGGGTSDEGTVFKFMDTTSVLTSANKLSVVSGQLTVFPNPSAGKFFLRGESGKWKVENVEVFNVLGEKVYSSTPTLLPQSGGGASFSYELNISSQPCGVYFYRALDENGMLVGEGKVIVQK
jgi:uncharacterized repeat protein (TIGR03803 family)